MKSKTVVAFGVFDLLHLGHLDFLSEARRLGTRLVVVVTRDARVRREKKHAPVFNEKERLQMIASLAAVDRAILGDKPGAYAMLARLKPDVVAVGHDQRIPPTAIKGAWKIVRLKARKRDRYSTTRIREALEGKGI